MEAVTPAGAPRARRPRPDDGLDAPGTVRNMLVIGGLGLVAFGD